MTQPIVVVLKVMQTSRRVLRMEKVSCGTSSSSVKFRIVVERTRPDHHTYPPYEFDNPDDAERAWKDLL